MLAYHVHGIMPWSLVSYLNQLDVKR